MNGGGEGRDVKLQSGPVLMRGHWYARFAGEVLVGGFLDDHHGAEEARERFEDMYRAVERRLPDGCRWYPDAAAIYGPLGTKLPNVGWLLNAAFAGVKRYGPPSAHPPAQSAPDFGHPVAGTPAARQLPPASSAPGPRAHGPISPGSSSRGRSR